MSNILKYKAVDIIRYIKNEMSSTQMHELERDMLEDEFFSDTVDGYRKGHIDMINQSLQRIENRIASIKLDISITQAASIGDSQYKNKDDIFESLVKSLIKKSIKLLFKVLQKLKLRQ